MSSPLERWRERCEREGNDRAVGMSKRPHFNEQAAFDDLEGELMDHDDCTVCDDIRIALTWLREEVERG